MILARMVLGARHLILAMPLILAPAALSGAERQTHVATLDADGVQRIRIVAGEYFFKPARLVVKANKPVELLVSREDGIVSHNLVIDAPAAGIRLKEDLSTEARTITFTPTIPGVYPFHCDKKLLFMASHREKGMEGALEVVP